MNTLFVGIDVSLKSNAVCVMSPAGETFCAFSVPNNTDGARLIVEKVLSYWAAAQAEQVRFGLEATASYGDLLAGFLKQDPSIPSSRKSIQILNAKQVSKFKKAYGDLPKTDRIDAFVIADCLRFGRIGRETYMDEKGKALQQLTRARYTLANDLSREKNRYLHHLYLKFSEMTQSPLFSNNFGAAAMALVEEFESVDQIAYTSIEDLTAFLCQKGKNHFADPAGLAQTIQKAARSSYRLPKTVEGSVNQILAVSAQTIRFYQRQLKEYDLVISSQIDNLPNPLTSIKGIGLVYSAGILAEIGDVHRFKDQAALAKYIGLSWTRYQSGEYEADHTHMIPSGNRYLKYYIIEAANLVRQHDAEFKRFYQQKYAETPKTPHKRALVLTARKFVRLIYALLRDNRLYTPPAVE